MILEEVECHPYRDDIYLNNIITPHDLIKDTDKKIINRILLREVTIEELQPVFSRALKTLPCHFTIKTNPGRKRGPGWALVKMDAGKKSNRPMVRIDK